MAKGKKKKRSNKSDEPTGKETIMSISQQELKTLLDAALQKMKDARPKVDSWVAAMATLRQQLADAIANSSDLTEAAASVEAIMAEYESQGSALSAAADAPGTTP